MIFRYSILTLLCLIVFSCKKAKETVRFLIATSDVDDAVIRGNSLNDFFKGKEEVYEIKEILLNEPKILFDHLDKVRERVKKQGEIDTFKGGVYCYSFIYKQDTLYCNSDFKIWRDSKRIYSYDDNSINKIMTENNYVKKINITINGNGLGSVGAGKIKKTK